MSIPFTWVYLIYDPFTKLFKIGKSDTPEVRFQQLCNASSYGTIPAAPTKYLFMEAWLCEASRETELHQYFQAVRVRGEWFDLIRYYEIDMWEYVETDVEYQIENELMADYKRWTGEGSASSVAAALYEALYERELQKVRCLEEQLEQAKLNGYFPKQLYPAPVIDPSDNWPNVITEAGAAQNADAIDEYQATGEMGF